MSSFQLGKYPHSWTSAHSCKSTQHSGEHTFCRTSCVLRSCCFKIGVSTLEAFFLFYEDYLLQLFIFSSNWRVIKILFSPCHNIHLEYRGGVRYNASQPTVWLPLYPQHFQGELGNMCGWLHFGCHNKCKMWLVFLSKGTEMLSILQYVRQRIVLPQMSCWETCN